MRSILRTLVRRSSWLTLAIVVIAIIMVACRGGAEGQQQVRPGVPSKRLTTSVIFPSNAPERGFTAYFVAKELGFYEEENLEVKFVNSEGSGAAIQQMVAGQVDLGTPHSSAVLNAANRGNPMRYIYTYSTAPTFGLFVREDSPIRDVRDLIGKTVGITEEGGGEVAILSAVIKGLGRDPTRDIKMVAIGEGGPATFQAIAGGQVDAWAGSYADLAVLTHTAAGRLRIRDITPPEFQAFPAHGLSTTKKVLDDSDKREAAVRLARALAKASLFCQTNWEACVQIIKKQNPEMFREEGLQRTIMERTRQITLVPEGKRFGEHNPEAWKLFIEFQRATDPQFRLTADFLNEFLVYDYLDEINRFDKNRIIKMAQEYKTS